MYMSVAKSRFWAIFPLLPSDHFFFPVASLISMLVGDSHVDLPLAAQISKIYTLALHVCCFWLEMGNVTLFSSSPWRRPTRFLGDAQEYLNWLNSLNPC